MATRGLVVMLLVVSALGLATSPENCREVLIKGLSTTRLSNCGEAEQCEAAASAILASYQACAGLEAVSYTSATDFLLGMLKGLQKETTSSSSCVNSLSATSAYWPLVVSTTQLLFSSEGSLTYIFDILTFFDQFLGEFINKVERCNLSTLQQHWSQFLTVEGVFKAMYVVGININSVAVNYI